MAHLRFTSLYMTLEKPVTNGEPPACKLQEQYSQGVCASHCPKPAHTPVARQTQTAALLNWQPVNKRRVKDAR